MCCTVPPVHMRSETAECGEKERDVNMQQLSLQDAAMNTTEMCQVLN